MLQHSQGEDENWMHEPGNPWITESCRSRGRAHGKPPLLGFLTRSRSVLLLALICALLLRRIAAKLLEGAGFVCVKRIRALGIPRFVAEVLVRPHP